jgi:hypothetical protein
MTPKQEQSVSPAAQTPPVGVEHGSGAQHGWVVEQD